jgi:hypothetical protein
MATYTTVSGDCWDMIAKSVYGDELLAYHLMQARENLPLLDYEIFPTGVTVYVPELTDADNLNDDLPDWRKD